MFNQRNMIPLSVPSIQGNERKYIKECLDTEWVSTAGKYVDIFEKKICEYTGAKYAVACVNGTSALHISLLLCGVKEDDEVIVPTLTFIAPINTIRYVNAEPIFMDADGYYNIDIQKTIEFINYETIFRDGYTYNKATQKRIPAIIPVHIFGNAVDIIPLIEICRDRNIKIIEDATESLGTKYSKQYLNEQHTGTVGDIGCYSFNGNKIITTGGGGMIVTNNKDYSDKASYLTTQAKDDLVRYVHDEIGFNYRMNNIQAAMGVAQLEQLDKFIEIKRNNYRIYKKAISNIDGLTIADVPEYCHPNYWFYALQIDKERYGKDREELMNYLGENGIQTRPVWYLNHLQKPYKNNQSYRIDNALGLWDETINLPCSAGLNETDLFKVVAKLNG
jgi:perosamine synthetase